MIIGLITRMTNQLICFKYILKIVKCRTSDTLSVTLIVINIHTNVKSNKSANCDVILKYNMAAKVLVALSAV